MWLHLEVIKNIKQITSDLFACVEYGQVSVPTYPCGTIGVLCCSKNATYKCSAPSRNADDQLLQNLKYYNPEIHKGAFMLPSFVKKAIE